MARQSKSLSNAFERLGQNYEQQQVSVIENSNMETVTNDVIGNSNMETVTNDVIGNSNMETVTSDVIGNSNMETVTSDVIGNSNTKASTNYVTLNSNNKAVTNDVTLNSNTETITDDVTVNRNISAGNSTIEAIKQDLLSMYKEKTNKEKVEDTHIRTTFLFRKDLAKRLDKLAKNKRGFKTMFINKAIEALLDEMEKK